MKARTVRLWSVVHTWTSLISTLFLLLLCLTGLPLIFHHEIDELLGYAPQPEAHASAARATPQVVADAALAADPGRVLQYVSWDKDEPGLVMAFTNSAPTGRPTTRPCVRSTRSRPRLLGPVGVGPMLIVLKLHTDMFAGQARKAVPRRDGAAVRGRHRLRRGAVLAVHPPPALCHHPRQCRAPRPLARLAQSDRRGDGGLGAGGGLDRRRQHLGRADAQPVEGDQLASMVAPYAGKPPPVHLASLDDVVARARQAAPGMDVAFIAFPGTPFTSSHHFAVFMRGDTALTARLLKPVLLDGETGEVADTRALPLYLQALLISQPLHFGDYGGMPLKVIWAVLDGLTIVVIGSGLYLWVARRRKRAPAKADAFARRAPVPS